MVVLFNHFRIEHWGLINLCIKCENQGDEYVGYQQTSPGEGGEGDTCKTDSDCWTKDINMLCR